MSSYDKLVARGRLKSDEQLRDELLDQRRAAFDAISAKIAAWGGWVTSVRGAREIAFECVPDSDIPQRLGRELTEDGTGQRIIPNAVTSEIRDSNGTIRERAYHAGRIPVLRFRFAI